MTCAATGSSGSSAHHTDYYGVMNTSILVVIPFTDSQRALLSSVAPSAQICFASPETVTSEQIAQSDIIMGNLSPAQLSAATNVKWVQLASAGAERYAAPGVLPKQVALTNAVGAYGEAVSEHMLAVLLELMKNLNLYRDNQNGHVWQDRGAVTSINGADVLVVGLGDIGTHFATLATALGAHVIGVRRHVSQPPQGVEKVVTLDTMNPAVVNADVVVSFLPGGEATHHVLGQSFFASMKQDSYFLNGGRGSVVDPDALREALTMGKLAGAGLDVTEPEPLPTDDPLWNMPNVVITPHVAGGFHLPAVLEHISAICSANLTSYLAGKPLNNLVAR